MGSQRPPALGNMGQPEMVLEDAGTLEGGSWQLVTSGNRQCSSSMPAAAQLKNRYEALASDKKEPTPVAGEAKPCSLPSPARERGLRPLPRGSNGGDG